MWIKDPKTGEKSVSLTAFMVGFSALLLKLLISGAVVSDFNFGVLSASDFAIAISPLAALYWGRKNTDSGSKE
jgi:hypothetical protein